MNNTLQYICALVLAGDVGMGVVKGAVEVVMGGVFGIVWGLLAGYLLDEVNWN